jgi:hypothetical protein
MQICYKRQDLSCETVLPFPSSSVRRKKIVITLNIRRTYIPASLWCWRAEDKCLYPQDGFSNSCFLKISSCLAYMAPNYKSCVWLRQKVLISEVTNVRAKNLYRKKKIKKGNFFNKLKISLKVCVLSHVEFVQKMYFWSYTIHFLQTLKPKWNG